MLSRISILQQLIGLWLASAAIAATLLAISYWQRGASSFFWLLPYPSGVRGFMLLVLQIVRADPLIAAALSVLVFAILATACLTIARLGVVTIHRAAAI